MFKMSAFPGSRELSFHEKRDLATRATLPGVANIHRAFLFEDSFVLDRLQDALHRLTRRHEALRTRFTRNAAGGFVREVMDEPGVLLARFEFADQVFPSDEITACLCEEAERGFSPGDYPLARVRVLTLQGNRSILHLSIAETICDGISATMLIHELSRLYIESIGGAEAGLPPMQYQLSDFVASQNAWMGTQSYRDSLQRVANRLESQIRESGGIENLYFSQTTSESQLLPGALPSGLISRVNRIAQLTKTSLPSVLTVASMLSVATLRRRRHNFFSFTTSNRHYAGTATLIGHLATTVPMHLDAAKYPDPQMHVQEVFKQLFTSVVQDGLVPIQEIGQELKSRFPPLPEGVSIKFGRSVMDIVHETRGPLFGMQTQPCSGLIPRRLGNEMKFIYAILPGGDIRLWIRALADGENDAIATRILEQMLDEWLVEIEHHRLLPAAC